MYGVVQIVQLFLTSAMYASHSSLSVTIVLCMKVSIGGEGAPWQVEPYGFVLDFATEETGWHSIDVSAAGMEFEVGDGMALGFEGIGSTLWLGGGYEPPDGPYPGDLWVNGIVYPPSGWDLAFRTWVVPGPGVLAMIGLSGLMMPRRRRA